MPLFIAVCVPLIFGTLRKPAAHTGVGWEGYFCAMRRSESLRSGSPHAPAEHPMSAPPGNVSLGMDWNPPSLMTRAPYWMHSPPSMWERMRGWCLNLREAAKEEEEEAAEGGHAKQP